MLKTIYRSLFDIESYGKRKNEKLIKIVSYMVFISIFSAIFAANIAFLKIQPIIDSFTDEIYSQVPEFTLSGDGLEINSDDVYEITFAGKSFYIDGSKSFLDIVVENKLDDDESVMFIGKDGYANVEGRTLKTGNYFSNISVLKDVKLEKDDFTLMYEVVKMINKDIVIVLLSIISIVFVLWTLIRAMVRGTIVWCIAKLKNKKVPYKTAYVIGAYSDTFYTVGVLVVLLTSMNIDIPYRLLGMEIISLIYLTLPTSVLLKKGDCNKSEGINSKKRP